MVARYGPRVTMSCDVMVADGQAHCQGRVLDVSLPGCLIECAQAFKVGDYVRRHAPSAGRERQWKEAVTLLEATGD